MPCDARESRTRFTHRSASVLIRHHAEGSLPECKQRHRDHDIIEYRWTEGKYERLAARVQQAERMWGIGVLMSVVEGNSEGQSWVAGFVQRLDTLRAPMGSGAHRV